MSTLIKVNCELQAFLTELTKMTKNPFFSIIIPVYNRQATIERAVRSCLTQTFSDIEVIIIDDKSTDKTKEVIDAISDSRIQYYCNEVNSERCFSRNKGFEHSIGKFVCFLDSDDYFLNNHLSIFYAKIEDLKTKTALLFSNTFNENEENVLEKRIVPLIERSNVFKYFLKYTPNPARVCISRDILNEFNFDERLPGLEDLDLWLRIASKYPIIQLTDYTSVYYVHSNSYSASDSLRFEKELSYHPIIKKQPELINRLPHSSLNRLSSMCHFHLVKSCIEKKQRRDFYKHAVKSFLLCPKGYNGKTNKILFVNALYFTPIIGPIIRSIVFFFNRKS